MRRRYLWIGFATIVMMGVGSLRSQTRGYTIGSISVERYNIFKQAEARENFVAGIANSLHRMTEEEVIRNEILFSSGERYDHDLVKETERNLRALSFISDVWIRHDTLRDSTINLTVQTRDKWTLSISPAYQQGGGLRNMSFTVKDDNFIGRGQGISMGYNYRSDRGYPHAIEMMFSDRRMFGSRWGTRVEYRNSEELSAQYISIDHPYYSDEAVWAAGAFVGTSRTRLRFYQDGVKAYEKDLRSESQSVTYSVSVGDRIKFRPAIGYIRVRSEGATNRPFDNLDLFSISLNLLRRTFHERMFLDAHGRIEDVPTGVQTGVTVGKRFPDGRQGQPPYYIQGNLHHSFFPADFYYLSQKTSFSTYWGQEGIQDGTLRSELLQHVQLIHRQLLTARVASTIGFHWSKDRQLHLGSHNGLRGYPTFAFSGNRRIVYNVEHRYFSSIEAWIFRLGTTLFWDGGLAWNESDKLRDQKFHQSVGMGLRIDNTKQKGTGIIRIDLAYNLDQKQLSEIMISANVYFSAFEEMNFVFPTMTGAEVE